jgi:BA14K-like protein
MRKFVMAAIATAALGTLGLAAPASAAEVQTAPVNELVAALKKGEVQSDYVQYRRHYRGGGARYVDRGRYRGNRYGYGGPRRYYGSRYGYYGPRYYRRDYGSAAAAGAIGLATGAIIGGAIAQSQAAPAYGGNAYCAQRFKSYDPASGTYLGYDGRRHPCP